MLNLNTGSLFLLTAKKKAVGREVEKFKCLILLTMNTKHDTQSKSVNTPSNTFANSILSSVFSREHEEDDSNSFEQITIEEPKQENADMVNSILSRLENKKEKAAVNLRLEAEEIEALPFDLSALETEGIFLNIDTHGLGSLTR